MSTEERREDQPQLPDTNFERVMERIGELHVALFAQSQCYSAVDLHTAFMSGARQARAYLEANK